MDRTKHFTPTREDTKVIRISRKIEGKTFLAEATYPLTKHVIQKTIIAADVLNMPFDKLCIKTNSVII